MDHEPVSRNEALARFMRLARICEERGSGVDKAVSAAEERVMPAPKFEASGGSTRVTLLTRRPYGDMTRDEVLNACYLHACLLYLKGERMTNATLRGRLGLPSCGGGTGFRLRSSSCRRGVGLQQWDQVFAEKQRKYHVANPRTGGIQQQIIDIKRLPSEPIEG